MKSRFICSTAILFVASTFVSNAGEIYKFDQQRSKIGFSVHQFLGTTNGKFTKFDGKIDIDRDHPENSSVTARTGIVKRDNHLRSPEFFAVDKYPEITFKNRSVKQSGPQAGDIVGDLTMHGVTKPVTLHVKLISSPNDTKETSWTVTSEPLKRRDFNLMFAQAAEAMSGISQTVTVSIEIHAMRAE